MDQIKKIRKATHAGSWYEGNKTSLEKTLKNYLSSSSSTNTNQNKILKGIIGPHAGFLYSGPTAAFAYKNINPEKYSKIFLLGPSHKFYTDSICLPYSEIYETPLGNIEVNSDIISEFKKDSNFNMLKKSEEEREHSLEMHLPFIKEVFGERKFTLIPLMVGCVDRSKQEYFGKILAKFLLEEDTLFIISSDFCHWGSNFDYRPIEGDVENTSNFIEKLDKKGIEYISNHDFKGFDYYLNETNNTICGSFPILVYLNALKSSGLADSTAETFLVKYAQSGKILTKKDMSVSYASIVTFV